MEKRKYEPQIYTNEDLKGKCGVYQIRNIINNKIYVGSSQNLYIRKREHFYTLSKGIHRNKHLQNAFNSYGKENLVFEIIEFCDIRDQINIEQYWIDTIQKYTNIYNIQPIADKITITEEIKDRMRGKTPWNKGKHGIYSEETLRKMKENRNIFGDRNPFYGMKHTQETKDKIQEANGIKVLCKETGIVYKSLHEAERITGINRTSISRVCHNTQKLAGGFTWCFIDK